MRAGRQSEPGRMSKDLPFRRLLKKVQMQGGARIPQSAFRNGGVGLFQQPAQQPVPRRLLKKVQMQGGARRAD